MNRTAMLFGVLAALGLCWGLTIPLGRLAILAGYNPIGLLTWQIIIVSVFTTLVLVIRRTPLPLSRRFLEVFVVIAFLGTLIPNFAGYNAARGLPAGISAIIIAFVPICTMPIAVLARFEPWQWSRAAGLALGAAAVILLVQPEALPAGIGWIFVAIALISPVCYGLEANYLVWRGDHGLDPFAMLWGASMIALAIALPTAFATNSFIGLWHPPRPEDWAILISGSAHCAAYAGYVWLVGQAGAVFAAQVAYIVTASGIAWSMLILNEGYSGHVWVAFALMMVGVALVQPRNDQSVSV